ncbi:MAG: diguanylate cyclase [Pseudomonadota bacterium]|nr:diguanylate cyclase [Pseudomonadota bacterium]
MWQPLFIKVLLIWIALTHAVLANPHHEEAVTLTTSYLTVNSSNLTIEQVVNSTSFISENNQFSLNTFNPETWIKLEITNRSASSHRRVLHNNLAYLSQNIEVYFYSNKRQIKKELFDLSDPSISARFTGSSLLHTLELAPEESQIIYLRSHSLYSQAYDFALHNIKGSQQALINKSLVANIIIVMLISLALYSLALFLFGEPIGLLFYSLYLINAGLGLFYLYGSFAQHFNIYDQSIHWLNITAIMVPLFLAFFIKSTFHTKRLIKPLDLMLNGVITLALIDVFIAVVFDLAMAMQLATVVFMASFVVIVLLSTKFIQEKHPLIIIFVVAYSIYIMGMSITLLSFYGFMTFNDYTFYASGIGLVIESILFSYLLRYNSILLKQKVIEHKLNEDRLSYLAHHDPLTKLSNRRLFLDISATMLKKADIEQEKLALLFIDIDGFKAVNDLYGHQLGDEVLRKIALRMTHKLRESDMVARVGGDEFVVLLTNISQNETACSVADELINSISKPYHIQGVEIEVGASIGISYYPESSNNIEELINKADKAMYEVKSRSKNSWNVYRDLNHS